MEAFVMESGSKTLHISEWERRFPGLLAGFSTRMDGFSNEPYASFNLGLHVGDDEQAVVANRKALAQRLGVAFEMWTCGDQVHGTKVTRVTANERGAGRERLSDALPATDGLTTNETGILLTSFYADCVPLLFLDPFHKAIGLAHAGWKGTVGRISEEMVKTFRNEYGSKAEDLYVAIGPSIGQCCYEVDERVMEHVRQSTGRWQECCVTQENGRFMLDLPRLNELIVTEAGVLPERVMRTGYCTSCRTDLFFSHRRENGKTGRMASFIGWKADEQWI